MSFLGSNNDLSNGQTCPIALSQVLAERYEKASTVLTTNRAYKEWVQIFNNDATMTSALLNRLLHHVETIVTEGRSYQSREHTETP